MGKQPRLRGRGRPRKNVTDGDITQYSDYGITRQQASELKKLADIPEQDFETLLGQRRGCRMPDSRAFIRAYFGIPQNKIVDQIILDRVEEWGRRHGFKNRWSATTWLLEWALEENPVPFSEESGDL